MRRVHGGTKSTLSMELSGPYYSAGEAVFHDDLTTPKQPFVTRLGRT